MDSCPGGELSWWVVVLVGSCPRGRHPRGTRPRGSCSQGRGHLIIWVPSEKKLNTRGAAATWSAAIWRDITTTP